MKVWLWQLWWTSSAGLLGAWALTVLWRKKSAAWRCLGWRLGLLAVLAGGALTVTSWRVELPWLAARETVAVVADGGAVETVTVSEATPAVPLPLMPARVVDWWLVVWLSGAALCLLPLTAGWWRVRRLLQNARPFADGRRVLVSDEAAVPLTVGVFSPRVVLPTAASAWPAERVRRVLAHEAAHGQRRDVAWALLARVVCALCWFNPLAWFAAHRQRVEAELACDDAVIVVGAAADDYATDLVQILRACPRGLLSPLTAGMAARPSQIRARLAAVLAADTDRATVRRGVVWTLTVSVLLVAAALTVTRVCRAPAAKTADDDALAPVSGGARLENGQVALDLRLLKFSPQARVLRSTQFQRAWAAGDVGEIMKMAGAAGELVTAPNVVTSTGQKGVVKYVSEMNYPAERGFSYTGSAGVKMLGPSGGWPIHFEKEELGLTVEYQPRILEHGIELNLTVRSVTMNQLSPPTLDVSFNKQEMHLARLVKDGGSFAVWLPWEQGNYGIRIGRENDQPARYGLIVSAGVIRKTPVGSVADKLERIVIPRVEFADADIGAVLGYVQEQSKALDPSGAGVDMVFKASPSAPDADWRPRRALTLSLRGQPLKKILDAVAQQSGYRYRAEEHAVYVFPGVEINEPVLLRAFAVPDGFFPAPIGTLTVEALRRGLVEKGVEFLAGTQVAWLPKSRKLVVRNTAGELEKIERLLGERKGGH